MHLTSQVLIWLAYGMSILPCISQTRWAMKCSESRAITQAQEEGHGGGYIAMTLTFKMATTGKWTNLTQKVANVKAIWVQSPTEHWPKATPSEHSSQTAHLLTVQPLALWSWCSHSLCVECEHLWRQWVCVCCKWLLVFKPTFLVRGRLWKGRLQRDRLWKGRLPSGRPRRGSPFCECKE